VIQGLPSFESPDEIRAAVATITVHHSMQLRSEDMYTLSKLALTLSKGSLIYALSLFGMLFVCYEFLPMLSDYN
jgi:hypothetical protein